LLVGKEVKAEKEREQTNKEGKGEFGKSRMKGGGFRQREFNRNKKEKKGGKSRKPRRRSVSANKEESLKRRRGQLNGLRKNLGPVKRWGGFLVYTGNKG